MSLRINNASPVVNSNQTILLHANPAAACIGTSLEMIRRRFADSLYGKVLLDQLGSEISKVQKG